MQKKSKPYQKKVLAVNKHDYFLQLTFIVRFMCTFPCEKGS